jgi:hypothetical protein
VSSWETGGTPHGIAVGHPLTRFTSGGGLPTDPALVDDAPRTLVPSLRLVWPQGSGPCLPIPRRDPSCLSAPSRASPAWRLPPLPPQGWRSALPICRDPPAGTSFESGARRPRLARISSSAGVRGRTECARRQHCTPSPARYHAGRLRNWALEDAHLTGGEIVVAAGDRELAAADRGSQVRFGGSQLLDAHGDIGPDRVVH